MCETLRSTSRNSIARNWIPTPGNVVFTLAIVMGLMWAQVAGAFSLPAGTPSTTSIPYQGRLGDSTGSPLNGDYNMTFRIYSVPDGGTALWVEPHTEGNKPSVVDGLFSVLLGSLVPIPTNVVTDNSVLYLGLEVESDGEMTPRTILGSVPYAVQALTVPAGAITTDKIGDGAVTAVKLGTDVQLEPADGSITSAKLAANAVATDKVADGSITSSKLASDVTTTPTDNSVTTTKLVDGAVTAAKLGSDVQLEPVNGSITTQKLADYSVTATKIMTGAVTEDALDPMIDLGLPAGMIVMWSGATTSVPSGWQLCDGSNGTPDLRDRFVVGAGNTYSAGDTGGVNEVSLTLNQLPSHDHGGSTSSSGNHSHSVASKRSDDGGSGENVPSINTGVSIGTSTSTNGAHTHTITAQGGNHAHENRPPYYGVAFICKQ
jgi:hypothetical protein